MKALIKLIVLVGFCLWVMGVPFSSTARFLGSATRLIYAQIEALKPAENAEAFTNYIDKHVNVSGANR